MIRHILLDLRTAIAKDFKDANNCTLYGAVYFVQNCDLSISKTIHYLMPETNKVEFKALFDDGRIFTFAKPDEAVNVSEITVKEWNQEFKAVK